MGESRGDRQPHDVIEHASDRVGSDWAYLSDLAEINPRSPSPTDGETVSFVAMADVSESGVIDNVELRKTSTGYTPFAVGDVLVAKITPCFENGKGAHVRGLPTRCGLGSTEFHVLRPRSTTSDRYLYHLTRTSQFRLRGEGLMSGSAGQRRVPKEFFSRYAVRMPPLEEQRWIAEILDTIDGTIQATERVISKLMHVERGLRRDLLSGRFEGARPEDWTRCRIGDFACVQRGASPRPIDNPAWFAMDGPGWIRISDVTASGDLLLRTRDKLSPAGAARSRRASPGDVIMSIAATIGVAIVVGIEACYHDGFVRIDHDDSVIPEFLAMLLKHHKDDFVRSGQTGTQANINSTIVAATEVALPSLEAQSAIVSAASSVRSSIRVERESLLALRETRDGLAADLLSGRVRTVAA